MKKIIQDVLSMFDMRLVRKSRYKFLDFSDKEVSPISIPYYANSQPILVELDCSLGRTNRWFDLSENSLDPHYCALEQGITENLSGGEFINRVSEILEVNRGKSVAENAAEQFGLDGLETRLKEYPFWAEVLPWHNRAIDEVLKSMPFEVKRNRSIHDLTIESNDPNEIMRIDNEYSIYSHAKQYERLFSSIKQSGLLQSEDCGLIYAEILIKDGEYRWKPGLDGNHRTTLLAAMGMKKIPLIVDKIIRYEEVEYWPNVVNKTFTQEEAKVIFKRIFDANPPGFYSRWIEYCNRSIVDSN